MEQFIEFQAKYGKFYGSQDEFNMRFAIFQANLKIAEKLNNQSATSYGVTKFMDLTPMEFANTVLMRVHKTGLAGTVAPQMPIRPLPVSFDWRNQGNVVTPVYNQGQCGSCWAFSTTENIESMWALSGKTLTSLAVQQIVDCDTSDGGCGGGNPPTAYQYVISAGGMEPWSDYPYTGQNDNCAFQSSDVVATISSWTYVTQSSDETQMQNYLYSNGPLSVCVDASTWQYYTGGIIMAGSGCGNSLDHCVMITGYGSQSGVNFWWVRNSWGTDWGQSGYLQVQMGSDVCGIADECTSSVV
jgi:cathepsin F